MSPRVDLELEDRIQSLRSTRRGFENFSLPGDVSASKRYWSEDIIDPPVEVSADGQIEQSDRPGIGYKIKEDLIESLTVRSQVFTA